MSASPIRSDKWNAAVNAFPEAARPLIDSIRDNRGVLPADSVEKVCTSTGVDIGTLMMKLLAVAANYAVVPVSHYPVGAVAAGMPVKGWASLYLGANFELENAALSCTVHAEQAATNNAWLSGEAGIQLLAISAAPCGYCRQFLYELVTASQLNILLPFNDTFLLPFSVTPLSTLLPQAFGPGDLGVTGGLMSPELGKHVLRLNSGNPLDPVIAAALAAAQASYAPYETPPVAPPATPVNFGYAGVAVVFANGVTVAGRNAEDAAYNPSLSPLESALSFANMTQPQPAALPPVTRCVLVEVPTFSSQRSATVAVLESIAPDVQLEYHEARIISTE